MKIQFTARHFKPTEGLRQQATEQLERLEKYDDILHAEVILTEEQKLSRTVRNAELIVKVFGKVLATKSSGQEFPQALDGATKKLEVQLKRHKEKSKSERLRRAKLVSPKKEQKE